MSKELEAASKAATLAGERLEYYFESYLEHQEKEDKSPVTKADLEAEEIIIKELKTATPHYNILSEEAGEINKNSEYTWVVDPLDGTTNFARGLPVFATTLALLKDDAIVLAVTYNPITNSKFSAQAGNSAFWNGTKMRVSEQENFEKSIVTLGRARDEESKKKTLSAVNSIYFQSHQRILGSSALELAWVASGRTEAFVCIGLNNWDVAAGVLLVKEAGGKITNFDGKDLVLSRDRDFLASNGKIHEELLELLKS